MSNNQRVGASRNPMASRVLLVPMAPMLFSMILLLLGVANLSFAQYSDATIDAGSGAVHIDSHIIDGSKPSLSYGVDVSWPMHHHPHEEADDNPHYRDYINGCYNQGFRKHERRADGNFQLKAEDDPRAGMLENKRFLRDCKNAEDIRLGMNLQQPKEMQNYTHAGYAKVDTPPKVMDLLKRFWEQNQNYVWPEFWEYGSTYVNHWQVETNMLDIGRYDVPYPLAKKDYEMIIRSVQEILESWTNERLVLTSAYGIRRYNEGAILAPHVDRLPLVSSAIINVFQENLSEPWALEVIGHDGKAHNLTSVPGEMILYESASVIHGRPYPLQGEGATYGSLFVHFEPLYHTLRNAQTTDSAQAKQEASKNAFEKAFREQRKKPTLKEIVDRSLADPTAEDSLKPPSNRFYRPRPPYVWKDYYGLYDQRFHFEYEEAAIPKSPSIVFETVTAHEAASRGKLSILKEIAKIRGKNSLFKADENGWKPLHEAARFGHADVVEYLLQEGAKVNERTNFKKGGNAMYWAKKEPKKHAKAIAVLEKYGGVLLMPIVKPVSSKSEQGGAKANGDSKTNDQSNKK